MTCSLSSCDWMAAFGNVAARERWLIVDRNDTGESVPFGGAGEMSVWSRASDRTSTASIAATPASAENTGRHAKATVSPNNFIVSISPTLRLGSQDIRTGRIGARTGPNIVMEKGR